MYASSMGLAFALFQSNMFGVLAHFAASRVDRELLLKHNLELC